MNNIIYRWHTIILNASMKFMIYLRYCFEQVFVKMSVTWLLADPQMLKMKVDQ